MDRRQCAVAAGQLLQNLDRLFRFVRPSQRRRTPELGCVIGGVVGGYVLQLLDRKLVLADVFQQIRGQ